jgi:hypothetical protein
MWVLLFFDFLLPPDPKFCGYCEPMPGCPHIEASELQSECTSTWSEDTLLELLLAEIGQ